MKSTISSHFAGMCALLVLALDARADTGSTNVISGVSTNANGPFFLGSNGSYNTLTITNAGTLKDTTGVLGYTAGTSNNSAMVIGSGSLWTNSGNLFVGYSGSFNQLTIAAGGLVVDNYGFVGSNASASGNSVLVSGLGSVWSNKNNLAVGYLGSNNTLIITNGGRVFNSVAYIGNAASNNSVLVSGVGSLWRNASSISIGSYGSNNNLTITDGGQVFSDGCSIGTWAGGTYNTALVTGPGSLWSNTSGLAIGIQGSSNSLAILDGAQVFSVGGGVGGDGGRNNSALVSGPGSVWYNAASLTIGYVGSLNRLTIANSAQVFNTDAYIGGKDLANPARSNMVVVTGAGSLWSNSGSLTIGYVGWSNSLTISNGARVFSASGIIGEHDSGAGNTRILISGAGSLWTNTGSLIIGLLGAANRVTITNGGQLLCNYAVIGEGYDPYPSGGTNLVRVGGSDSTWFNAGDLLIGSNTDVNNLTVADSARVFSGNTYIGLKSRAKSNSVLVTGPASLWSNSGVLVLGVTSVFNQLTISNGGYVANGSSYVGFNPGANNNGVVVHGADSIWSNNGSLYVGYSGSINRLTITNGGHVVGANSTIGAFAEANSNAVLVTGTGSLWTNNGFLYIGDLGSANRLTVSSGGQVLSSDSYIGYGSPSSNNAVLVTGSGSIWSNNALHIGVYASSNSLTVANGGHVVGWRGYIGYYAESSNNAAVVTGTGSLWSNSGSFYVGLNGSAGCMTIANGGQVINGGGFLGYYSSSSNNAVLVTDSGSRWINTVNLNVGSDGSGNQLTISNNGTVNAPNIVIGSSSTSTGNVITVTGGYLYGTNTSATGWLDVRRGTLTLNSGTVTVNQLIATNFASSAANFNGGTLNSGGSTVNNASIFRVGNGTSAANLHLLGGTHFFANSLFINTNGWLTGTGAITGVITNAGTIAPGNSPGILSVSGDLTLLTNSLLLLELAGTNSGLYDQINVSGALAFDGTLTLSLLDGFTVSAGDRFDLFDFSGSSGSFSLTNLPGLSASMYWDTSALYTSGEIEADWMTGSLQVTLAPVAAVSAGAQWQVDGGTWQNSGDTVPDLVIGEHTLAFKDVEGWIKPTNRVVQIDFGETTVTNLNYELTPVLLAATSCKTHSAAGAINLTLNLNPAVNPTVEPRKNGPTQLLFTFNKEMMATDGTLDATEFTLTNATYVSASILSSNLTLNLTNAVDQSRVTVVLNGLSDLTGNPLVGTNAVVIRALYGDANQSGTVNIADMQVIKFKLASTVSATNFLYDLNLSGAINIADMQVAKSMLSHTVPANSVDTGANSLVTLLDTTLSSTGDSSASTVTLGEALGAPELVWNTDGDAVWMTTTSLDGSYMAWSGSIGHLNVSWVETTVTGPGTLSFQWKVSSEADADYLTFSMDGEDQPGRISGEADWQTLTFNIPSGTHRLTWTYAKNRTNASGLDAGWLRRVTYQRNP